jgi:hypothetical protein
MSSVRRIALGLLLALVAPGLVFAQGNTTGSFEGQVTDEQGLALPACPG